jgi:hypothetical protein
MFHSTIPETPGGPKSCVFYENDTLMIILTVLQHAKYRHIFDVSESVAAMPLPMVVVPKD